MMAIKRGYIVIFLLGFGFLLLLHLAPQADDNGLLGRGPEDEAGAIPILIVRRRSFPEDFVFGSASSAYQYEGAAFMYGKGPSIWDSYTHQHPERIAGQSNGDVAIDSYHRYQEDIEDMRDIGFDAYRFSIAWSRILPNGNLEGGVNWREIEHYNRIINDLLANGIQPYITLFHWDVPQALQDNYQGFMSHNIVNDFRDFAEVCFKKFGDRVKHWITLNEQYIFATKSYVRGEYAPGRCSDWQPYNCLGGDSGTEPYIVGHNLILAHAAAVQLYKTKYQAKQKGEIGIALASDWYVPYSNNGTDEEAKNRALDFSLGWFLHPMIYGDYPPRMKAIVRERLPKFRDNQITSIVGSFDFIGINYYTTNYAKYNPDAVGPEPSYLTDIAAKLTTDRNGVSIGPKVSASSWLAAYPRGLQDLLLYTKMHYKNPAIYITENGWLDNNSPNVRELIRDKGRVKYHHDHLYYLLKAINADGVRVKGYFAWSLMDNFEWASGYTVRFGLYYVDYNNNLTRIPKDSARWFHNFLST